MSLTTETDKEKLRVDAVSILHSIWKEIDWERIEGTRRKTFNDEFASKVKSSTHTDNMQKFVDKLCRKLEIRSISDHRVAEIIKNTDHYEMLNIMRDETVYLILLMKEEM